MTTWRGPWRFLTRAQLRFLDALCAKAKPWSQVEEAWTVLYGKGKTRKKRLDRGKR